MSIKNYGRIESVDELTALVDRLIDDDGLPIAYDIETGYHGPDREKASLHPETAMVVGFSFTNSTDWARYVPLAHDTGPNLDPAACAEQLWRLLATGRGVAHNATFELRHLSRFFRHHLGKRAGTGYYPNHSDTQIEAYLAAEHQFFGLKYLTKQVFDHQMIELADLFPGLTKKQQKALRFNTLDPTDPKVIEYACEDSAWCLAHHQRTWPQVKDMLLYKVESMIGAKVVPAMEDYGLRYDWAFLRRGAEELRGFRDRFNADIMNDLSALVGTTVAVNLASPPQIADILYTRLGMSTTVYTPTTKDLPPEQRRMSTGKIALERLAKQHAVVKRITEWKFMTRLLGTYLDKYEGLYQWAEDGHTHPNHMPALVVTGRFAVSDPPYQQSPKKYHYDLEAGRVAHAEHAAAHGPKCGCEMFAPPPGTCFRFNFRDAIIAPPDHYILGFDLSQAELRAIAGEAKESALLRAFETGQDVHTLTAALMLKIPVEEVTPEQRAIGKTMNFALLYGMGIKSLADRLALDLDEAERLYNAYFGVYANIAAWAEKQRAHGQRYGYVISRFGRRLPIWEYKSDKRWIQQKGDRACVNYPIQGAATGDYMKIAMCRAHQAIEDAGLADKVHLVMNVHDALEWYVHKSVTPQRVISLLNPAVIFDVPGWPAMQADWHMAKRWGSPWEVEVRPDGGLSIKGEKVYDLAPAVEVDEDTGEEVEVLPAVDIDTLRQAAGAPSTEHLGAVPDLALDPTKEQTAQVREQFIPGRRVTVELADMPTEDGWRRFSDLLAAQPGPDTVTVRTPEGELPLPGTYTLSTKDTARVSVLLGPVRITTDAADVDTAAVVAGLTF